jgi:hypothetical protein
MKCVKKLEVFTQNEMEWKQKIGYPQNMIWGLKISFSCRHYKGFKVFDTPAMNSFKRFMKSVIPLPFQM